MQKLHWGPLAVATAIGVALSTFPANSAHSLTQESAQSSAASGEPISDLIHGVLFLLVIAGFVICSRISKSKS